MNSETGQIVLGDGTVEFTLSAGGMVNLRADPCDRVHFGAVDVVVLANGLSYRLSLFAECYITEVLGRAPNLRPVLCPTVDYVLWRGEAGGLLLVGSVEVVFVHATQHRVTPVLRMFRETVRDHGFERLELLVLEDSCLLVYEGGAARIRNDGHALWHTALLWNDMLEGHDSNFLYFWSEFSEVDGESYEGEFAISVADGRKVRLSQRQDRAR